ncbi:MAG: hypothetical protein Q8K30_02165 [Candidatus Gracilibacteria bacterium]|nr:hypothetical protein [Candidatus Gracilibacteria bacterium]
MTNVIEFGNFVEYKKRNHETSLGLELPKNVTQIPTFMNISDSLEKEIDEFQNQIIIVIKTIIDNGVVDYLDTTHQSNTQKNIKKLNKDTNKLFDLMNKHAIIIDYTIDYLENALDVYFEGKFILNAIGDILSVYRDEVFEILMKKYVDKNDNEEVVSNEMYYNNDENEEAESMNDDNDELQLEFDKLIENIINNGISDYLVSINQLDTPLIRKKYYEVTNKIYVQMLLEANIIDDTIIYLEDEVNYTFNDDFIINAANDLLSIYREDVFDLLVEKYGNNK